MNEKSVLVLGVGNLLLGDEGVGVHIAKRLQTMVLPPWVEVVDGGTGGFELINFFYGRKRIIIIDAMKADARPGSAFRFKAEEITPEWPSSFSAHQQGLPELLRFCNQLIPPPEIIIYGIVPKELGSMTMQLSSTVKRRMWRIIAMLLNDLKTF